MTCFTVRPEMKMKQPIEWISHHNFPAFSSIIEICAGSNTSS